MHNPMITFSVPSRKRRTSDTFAAFPSEVPLGNAGPPTLLPRFRRRSPSETQDLRHFCHISVGGPPQKHRTSDTFASFPSEVPFKNKGPPTLFQQVCRRSP